MDSPTLSPNGDVKRGNPLVVAAAITNTIAILLTALRLYVRVRIVKRPNWDDLWHVLGLVRLFPLSIQLRCRACTIVKSLAYTSTLGILGQRRGSSHGSCIAWDWSACDLLIPRSVLAEPEALARVRIFPHHLHGMHQDIDLPFHNGPVVSSPGILGDTVVFVLTCGCAF